MENSVGYRGYDMIVLFLFRELQYNLAIGEDLDRRLLRKGGRGGGARMIQNPCSSSTADLESGLVL
jgi:hypothetical protein